MAQYLSRVENISDNALNELFVDLYNINDNSNVNGNLPLKEVTAVKWNDNEDSDIVQYTSVSQLVANVCLFVV